VRYIVGRSLNLLDIPIGIGSDKVLLIMREMEVFIVKSRNVLSIFVHRDYSKLLRASLSLQKSPLYVSLHPDNVNDRPGRPR